MNALIRPIAALLWLVFWSGVAPARDIAISPDGATLVTANHDARSLSVIDVVSGAVQAELALGVRPDNVVLDGDGKIWVTSRGADQLIVVQLPTGTELARLTLSDEPFDVLRVTPELVVVTLFGSGGLAFIDPATHLVSGAIEVPDGPRSMALSTDGATLYVTHFRTGEVSVIDVATRQLQVTIRPEADGSLLQNIAVAADRLYLPQTRANVSNPFLLFDTTVFPVVSVIDPINHVAIPAERFSLDVVDEPVGLPLDAALTASHLFVLNAASNDLIAINRASRQSDAHLELDHNPRSMVLSGDRSLLFVHNSLGASVSVVDTAALAIVNEISVAASPLSASLANGKRLFNSSDRNDLARDQWIACATCHFDGEMDGRTWFFPDGPRNTPSLLGVGETGPFHWSGDLDELHDVEATIRGIQAGTGLAAGPDNCAPTCDAGPPNSGRSQDLDDLAAFMSSLQLAPNPNLDAAGNLSPAARRGEALFHSAAGCADCHPPPTYADGLNHDVGTGGAVGERKGPDFNTPSLRGLYATAPYLHDGRAPTLSAVLTEYNPSDLHGSTTAMTSQDVEDLVAFLRSLNHVPPLFRSGFE